MNEIKPVKYKHYKGNFYEVTGFARHSETLEDMVIYRALYGDGGTWVRPAKMWNETVNINGKAVKRFEYTGETAEQINVVFENEKIRVEEIISNGAVSPVDFWYDSTSYEWVSVTAGRAVLEFESCEAELKAGENYYIKAHVKHRIKYVSPDCRWLCVYIK